MTQLAELDSELGKRAVCFDGYCQAACWHDDECGDSEICTDYGRCVPFTGELTGVDPGGDQREPLQAGISNVLMDFPIGLSSAGYGSRAQASSNQYAQDLYPSAGETHGLFARGIALDNGERELVIIRLPIIFPHQVLHEDVARALQEDTGADWRNSLVISATHTHSGPGRHWPIPNDSTVSLGVFGTDAYSHQIYEGLRDTVIKTAREAIANKVPAKFGWQIVEAFDNDDLIASDRWGGTPPFDDNRLLLFRIDDLNDEPLAAAVSFGSHGTFYETTYMTSDALGAVERGLEQRLGDAWDKHVPVLYFQENGGTMSPRGDRHGHQETQKFDALGSYFADRAFDAFQTMTTKTDIELDARTHRFRIDLERIGYDPDEWTSRSAKTVNDTLWHGGLNCNSTEDSDYATHAEPGKYFCLPLSALLQNRPNTLFYRSMTTALKIDGLTIVTVPGENSMETGYQIVRDLVNELGMDWRNLFIWGYSQDHQLYITPTNLRGELPFFPGISTPQALDDYPDFAFSWLQGGYEPSLAVWGWRFGDYIVEQAIDAVKLLEGMPVATEDVYPLQMTPPDEDPFTIDDTPAAQAGTVTQDVPAQIRRFDALEFAWIGGHPGAEAPQVPLVSLKLREVDGTYSQVMTRSRTSYDNREPEMMTRVREGAGDLPEWVVRWEELQNFPAGIYRFEVEGNYSNAGTRTPYQLTSGDFEVLPFQGIVVQAELQAGQASGTLAYPAAENLDFLETVGDRGAVAGNFRMRHPLVGTGLPNPLEPGADIADAGIVVRAIRSNGTVAETITGASVTLATEMRDVGGRTIPVTVFSADVPNGTAMIEVDVTDLWGNVGQYR